MVKLKKQTNTLVKIEGSDGTSFLDIPRTLTFTIVDEDGHSGYFSNNPEDVSIELEGNIIFFKISDVSVDGLNFLDAQSFINYIYDL